MYFAHRLAGEEEEGTRAKRGKKPKIANDFLYVVRMHFVHTRFVGTRKKEKERKICEIVSSLQFT